MDTTLVPTSPCIFMISAGTLPRVRMSVMLLPALLPSLPITQGPRHARLSGTPARLSVAPPAQQAVLPVVPPVQQAALPVVPPAPTAQPVVLPEAQPVVPPRPPTFAPWQQHLMFLITPAMTVPMAVQMQPQPATPQVMVAAGLYLGHDVMPLPQELFTRITKLWNLWRSKSCCQRHGCNGERRST